MSITDEEVKHMADLASLSLTESELAKMQGELQTIIEYVKQLDELPCNVTTDRATGATMLREDVPQKSMKHAEVFLNTQNQQNQFFSVPKVIDIKTGK